MRKTTIFPRDSQLDQPAAWCHYCGRGLFDEEEFYGMNGIAVCGECLPLFAKGQYASCRVTGREWRRL